MSQLTDEELAALAKAERRRHTAARIKCSKISFLGYSYD
jgi:hypothetical protein